MAYTVSWYDGNCFKELVFQDIKLFSTKLKNLRKSKGLTISELSDRIGWHEDCIKRWESNEAPLPEALKVLTLFFSVPQEYFLSGNMSGSEQLSLFD